MPDKKVIIAGAGIAFGTIVVIGSLLAGFVFPSIVIDKLHDALIVDKAQPDKESFQHWVNDDYSDAAPYYKVFTLFNLTNYQAVQATGAKPIYQSVGPYYYRRYETKLNYTFFDDGKKVSYTTYEPLYYEADLGNEALNPLTDVVYNINPTYVGLIVGAGGEENLIQGLVPPTWLGVMDSINSQDGYLGLVLDQFFIEYLLYNEQSLIAEIIATQGGDQQTAFAEFLDIWANYTEDPTDLAGFNSTMRISVNGTSSNINSTVAAALFDNNNPLALTSTDPSGVGFHYWFGAELGDPSATALLESTFGLTPDQMSLIISWRNRFKPTYYNSLSAAYGVANVSDLGYYQWGMGNLTAVDIQQYVQPIPIPVTPEYAIWSQGTSFFSVDQAKVLLTGPTSLLNETNYFTFLYLLQTQDWTTINMMWGLSPQQAGALYQYIQAVIADVYVVGALEQAFAVGSGLITWHTVDEWLWTCTDPLLSQLSPENAACNLFTNDTSEAEAAQNNKASTYWTGKSDLDKIVQYIDYEGNTTIYLWAEPETVTGTDASQFAPDVKTSDTLQAYVSDLGRVVDIVYEKKVDLKGISLYRFVLADYMLAVNPVYYQSIAGFANMSSDNAGTPVFLCKPYFLDCDQYWANQVQLDEKASSSYDTTIDVEPISGLSMDVHKRLQLNIYYSNSTDFTSLFSVFSPNITSGLFYPVVWVDETSQLTSKQADDFKSAVLGPLKAFKVTFFAGSAVGGILLVAFVAGLVYLIKYQKPTYQYAPLGTTM